LQENLTLTENINSTTSSYESQLAKAAERFSNLELDFNSLSEELMAKNSRLGRVQLEFEKLDENFHQVSRELEQSRATKNEDESQRLNVESLEKNLQEHERVIRERGEQIGSYKSEIEALKANLEESKALIMSQLTSVMSLAGLEEQNNQLTSEIAQLKEQLIQPPKEALLINFDDDSEKLKELNRNLSEKLAELTNENMKLSEANSQAMNNESVRFNAQLDDLNKKLADLSAEKEQLLISCNQLAAEKEALANNAEKHDQAELTSQSTQNEELERIRSEMNAFNNVKQLEFEELTKKYELNEQLLTEQIKELTSKCLLR
jgi:chromosome segregation ATPase